MLFGADWAALIEAAERDLCAGLAELARAAGEDAFAAPIGGGVAAYAGPGAPCNKVIGAGLAGPLEEDALAAIEGAYAARGAPVQVELASLADPATATSLTRRGYALVGFEDVLGRRPGPVASRRGEVEVGVTDELATYTRVIAEGFARPDLGPEGGHPHEQVPAGLEATLARFAAAPGMSCYLARLDGAVAGAGCLRTGGPVAQLCGAATLPAFRRRGVQTALLQVRIAAAARAGSEVVTMTTLPGSRSQRNALAQGFALLYTRAILVKPAPAG